MNRREMTDISEVVKQLAEARQILITRQNAMDLKTKAFKSLHAELLGEIEDRQTKVRLIENKLRDATVTYYTDTGDKKPTQGVEVKVGTKLEYDPEKALEWAQAHKIALVPESLDRGAFEKIAKATKIDFVTETEKPAAYISTDLSFALEPLRISEEEVAA
jgi:hypothetical protein